MPTGDTRAVRPDAALAALAGVEAEVKAEAKAKAEAEVRVEAEQASAVKTRAAKAAAKVAKAAPKQAADEAEGAAVEASVQVVLVLALTLVLARVTVIDAAVARARVRGHVTAHVFIVTTSTTTVLLAADRAVRSRSVRNTTRIDIGVTVLRHCHPHVRRLRVPLDRVQWHRPRRLPPRRMCPPRSHDRALRDDSASCLECVSFVCQVHVSPCLDRKVQKR